MVIATLYKGKGVETDRRDDVLSSSSSSSSIYQDLPSSHFLSHSGGMPSSSSWTGRKDARKDGSTKGSRYAALLEAYSTGSVSTEDRDQLSHIPSHFLDSFSMRESNQDQDRAHMPDTSTLAAADFDVDVRSGFLPPEAPVSRLQGIEEEMWEVALDKAISIPLRIGGGNLQTSASEQLEALRWRRDIRRMLVVHPSPQIISDIRFARRAHQVLSFLAHFYIHSQPPAIDTAPLAPWYSRWSLRQSTPSQDDMDRLNEVKGMYKSTVPASIAVPWVALCNLLDLPPVLTYADTVMWNWHLKDPSRGFNNENVEITTSFTGTASEKHFYKTSLLIERRGVAALTLMRQSLDEAFMGGTLAKRRISSYLEKLSRVVDDLSKILYDVRKECNPAIFYWGIRPWLNGGDSGVDVETGEKGWIFEGVEEYQGKRKHFTGPSAGQSTLIHSLDVFLGVDHGKRKQSNQSKSEQENATFMEKMQLYMPGHHRNFLNHLKSISFAEVSEELEGELDEDDDEEAAKARAARRHPIRSLLLAGESSDADDIVDMKLREAYNLVLNSLKHLRDEHMRVATLYIIQQMRLSPPAEYARMDADSIVAASNTSDKVIKGTGGTDLVSFLRDCRKNTVSALCS